MPACWHLPRYLHPCTSSADTSLLVGQKRPCSTQITQALLQLPSAQESQVKHGVHSEHTDEYMIGLVTASSCGKGSVKTAGFPEEVANTRFA